jgi:hypothetical protein
MLDGIYTNVFVGDNAKIKCQPIFLFIVKIFQKIIVQTEACAVD